jgi:hypothetical protein
LTTQYLEEADQLAEQIAVIDHGRVIAQGTGNELKDRVGGQILEVELANAAQRDEARAALARVGCGDPELGERPDRITLPAPRDGLELIEDAAVRLSTTSSSSSRVRRPAGTAPAYRHRPTRGARPDQAGRARPLAGGCRRCGFVLRRGRSCAERSPTPAW